MVGEECASCNVIYGIMQRRNDAVFVTGALRTKVSGREGQGEKGRKIIIIGSGPQ